MEEKLQFVPSLKDAFAIGMKNLVPIVLSALYIERRYFLFVTYLIISRYRKTQT